MNGNVLSNAFCSRTTGASNMSLNKRIMFVQLISQTDWTEVKKQEGESQFLFLIREKLPVIFRHFIQNS